MVSGQRGHAEALREEVAAVWPRWGCGCRRRRPASCTSTRALTSSGSTSVGDGNEERQKQCVYTTPSRKAVQAAKDKVRWKTRRSTLHLGLAELITSLNQTLRGWATYFRHGVSSRAFHHLDQHAWWRIVGWLRAKYKGKTRLSWKELRRRFCDQGWRFAHEGVVFTGASSVKVIRYRYRGSTITTRGHRHRQPPPAADQRSRHVESPVR